jgi:hypothetical protein
MIRIWNSYTKNTAVCFQPLVIVKLVPLQGSARYHSGGHRGATGAVYPWDTEWNTYGTCDCRSSTDRKDTSQRCRNYSCGRTAVKRSTKYRTRSDTIPPRILEQLLTDRLQPYHHSPSARILPDDRSANGTTSVHWGWFPSTYHSVDKRSTFCSWGCIQRPQQSSLSWDNPHAIRERWSGLSKIVGDAVVGLYPLPERLTAQWYRDFLETLYRDCLMMCPWLCGRGCGFSTTEFQCTVGKSPAVVECIVSKKVEQTSRANCMTSLVARSNSD